MSVEQEFARSLWLSRQRLGMTQEEMAERCGISLRHYQNVEAGRVGPRLQVLSQICTAAELSVDRLLHSGQPADGSL